MKKYYMCMTLLALVLLTGCGKRYVPISGQVLYNDKPASDIIILFEPKGTADVLTEPGTAKTDASGNFTLYSANSKKNGVQPGEYTTYFGWKDPANQKISDNPEENAHLKFAKCPYEFPKAINDGAFVYTVTPKGDKNVVFKITKDNITW